MTIMNYVECTGQAGCGLHSGVEQEPEAKVEMAPDTQNSSLQQCSDPRLFAFSVNCDIPKLSASRRVPEQTPQRDVDRKEN
jgi:hypothetical protein